MTAGAEPPANEPVTFNARITVKVEFDYDGIEAPDTAEAA